MPSPEQVCFKVEKEDFLKLSQSEQNSLIYSCLMEMQTKIDWKWKRVMTIGAIAGFIGGFVNHTARTLLGINNL